MTKTTSSAAKARKSLVRVGMFLFTMAEVVAVTHRFDALVSPAQQEKARAKKPIDLFADEDEDGDIFSEKKNAPAASKKEAEKEQPKQAEKRVNIHMLWSLMPPAWIIYSFTVAFRCRQEPSHCSAPAQKAY